MIPRLLTATIVALTSVTALAAPAHKAPKSARHPLAYVAHLRLHVVTTSTSTRVIVSPGDIAASRLTKRNGSGKWQVASGALELTGAKPAGRKSITADLIYENPTTEPTMQVRVEKASGHTRVSVASVLPKAAHRVGTVVNNKSWPVTGTFARTRLMGSHPAQLPRSDSRKLVLAFYYPWYHAYRDPHLADRPRQARSTYTKAGVSSMTAQAKRHGIDGFIVSWAGDRIDGPQFRLALHAAQRQHQVITGYLESVIAGSHGGPRAALAWLAGLLRYSHQRVFLKTARGVPVVFVYQMSTFSPSQWQNIRHQLWVKYHRKVRLVGDTEDPSFLSQEWGIHTYAATGPVAGMRNFSLTNGVASKARAALHPHATKKLFAATVTPGYDDQRLRGNQDPVIPRNGGRRYAESWSAALLGQPDWILVTSWNEWYEDTEVEPGTATGSKALQQTKHEAMRWQRH